MVAVEEQSCGIALGGVVVPWTRQFGGKVDWRPPSDRLVVKEAVNREAEPTDVRLEQNQPPAFGQHPPSFAQEGIRSAQMMEDIEQNQMRKTALEEWQFITVTSKIEPRVRE